VVEPFLPALGRLTVTGEWWQIWADGRWDDLTPRPTRHTTTGA
jgi:hypothetical protein